MEDPSELKSVKREPNDEEKTSTEMQMDTDQEKIDDSLVPSAVYIKMEPQEEETEVPVVAGMSKEVCSNSDGENEIDEPMVHIECEVLLDEDPLKSGIESKAVVKDKKKHFTPEEKMKNKIEELKQVKYDLTTTEQSEYPKIVFVNNKIKFLEKPIVEKPPVIHTCPICQKVFKYKCGLDTHLLRHAGIRPFVCAVCGKSFSAKGNLDEHTLIHTGEKKYSCDVCNKSFTGRSALHSHRLIHTNDQSFACNECDKTFTKKKYLDRHMKVHVGDKPHICYICDKAFIENAYLTRHKRVHTGERPYTCEICNKSFTQKSSLKTHQSVHNK